jgi:hypothetical protein
MHISPFFHALRTAYSAELEDMRCDSEGLVVLDRRLAQRRGEMGFLLNMLESSPEMVAVVLHKAFHFTSVAAMEQLLTQEPEDLCDWDTLSGTVEIADWAASMVRTIRQQPAGDWFLSVAAALEYMEGAHHRRDAEASGDGDDAGPGDRDGEGDDGLRPLSADDADDTDARTREEAAADWMAEQGFERKE